MKTRISMLCAVGALALAASLVPVSSAAAETPPGKAEVKQVAQDEAFGGGAFQTLLLTYEVDAYAPLVEPDAVLSLTLRHGPMSTSMRAKLQISSVTPSEHNAEQETLRFHGVSRNEAYPEDGSDENNTFAKFSPCVDLEIVIANPALLGKFKPGDTFYVDFTPVPA
jgi:hypothetical protein